MVVGVVNGKSCRGGQRLEYVRQIFEDVGCCKYLELIRLDEIAQLGGLLQTKLMKKREGEREVERERDTTDGSVLAITCQGHLASLKN